MIIVEGSDNSGKTTLVKQLIASDPSLQLLHRERFKPQAGGTIFTSYLQMLLPTGEATAYAMANSVGDRCLASECIYGSLFREGCRLSFAEHVMIQAVLKRMNAIVVFCDPPDATILASWSNRPQLYDDPLVIARAYRKRVRAIFSGLTVYDYDWTSARAANQREMLLREHARRLRALELTTCATNNLPLSTDAPR